MGVAHRGSTGRDRLRGEHARVGVAPDRATWRTAAPPPARAGRRRPSSSTTARPPRWSWRAGSTCGEPISSHGGTPATGGPRCRSTRSADGARRHAPRPPPTGGPPAAPRHHPDDRPPGRDPERPGPRPVAIDGVSVPPAARVTVAVVTRRVRAGRSSRAVGGCPTERRIAPIPSPALADAGAGRSAGARGDCGRVPVRELHRRRGRRAAPVLHQPRPPGVRARQPPRGREGRAVRSLLAHATRACVVSSSTNSSTTSTSPATSPSTPPSGFDAPRSSTTASSSSTATTRLRSSGGVHLACEQSSNLLTKILEWGRLMAYLEQSTRYIEYDKKLDGRFRYYRDTRGARVARARRGATSPTWTRSSRPTRSCCRCSRSGRASATPRNPRDSDFVYKQTIKAKACDAIRGILPAATLSNVGIYGTGQGYEALLLRMRAHPLPEARSYADHDARGAPQGHPQLPHQGRPGGPGRGLERVPGRDPPLHAGSSSNGSSRTSGPSRGLRSPSATSIPTARTSCSPRSATRRPTCPTTSCWRRSAR